MKMPAHSQAGNATFGVVILIIVIAAAAFAGGMWYTRTTMRFPVIKTQPRLPTKAIPQEASASSSGQPVIEVSEPPATIEKGEKITFFTIDLGQIQKLSSARVPLLPQSGEVVTKMDNQGNVFTSDGTSIFRINALTGKTTIAYTPVSPPGLIESLVFVSGSTVGVSYGPDRSLEGSSGKPIVLQTIDVANDMPSGLLGQFKADFFSRYRYLGRYANGELAYQVGGDGCGGFGTIYSLEASASALLQTGIGCSSDPRFIGYDSAKQQVILANVLDGSLERQVITTIEAVAIPRGTRTQLHNFTMEAKPVYQVVGDLELSRIAGLTDDGVILVYLADGAVKRIPFKSDGEAHLVSFMGEVMYVADFNKKTFTKLDLLTQNTSLASYDGIFNPAGNSPAFAGLDPSGRPVFYVLEIDGPLY